MKSAEERMNIVETYRELGSYRAAGRACGVDHKTVKAVVERVELAWDATSRRRQQLALPVVVGGYGNAGQRAAARVLRRGS